MARQIAQGTRGRKLAVALLGGCLLLALAACGAPQESEPLVIAYPSPPDSPRYFYDRTLTGSRDVAALTTAERFRRFATGEAITGQGFPKPFSVVANQGRIYISDTVSRRISVLDFPGGRYFEFGDEGMGRLAKPLGMAVDGAGRVYVCDGTTKRILVYDAEGNYLTAIGGLEMFHRPSAVAVNDTGSRIYVVDTGGVDTREHRIRVFDAKGDHLFDIGVRGRGEGQFNLPLAASVGPDGRLYVLDTGNFRVQVFAADGTFLSSFGEAGRRPGQFSHPKGIDIDGQGRIFITDSGFGNLQIFDSEGRILMFIGDRSERGGAGEFLLPAGVAVDSDGRIFVVDQFFQKIEVFRPADLPADAPIGGIAPARILDGLLTAQV